ncbi:MAG: rhomboid family intramembrane serine protease [bacterium]|nr:rhomboid family intramembrane serine protease [bacterium]
MLPEAPLENRPRHPLEQDPAKVTAAEREALRKTRVTLRIPVVRPTATYILIAINIVVFTVRALSPEIDFMLVEWGANNQVMIFANGELHRLFTSMFLHAGIHLPFGQFAFQNAIHLVLNVSAILSSGQIIEPMFGHTRFVLIYLLGGLMGSIFSALLGSPSTFSLGASGAAFALLGAEFVYLYKHRKLFGVQAQNQMRGLLVLAATNLGFGILSSLSESGMRIDNWAHIGGAVGGIVLAWSISPLFLVRPHPDQSNTLLGEDVNPLKGRTSAISLYIAGLILLLIMGSLIV